MAHNIHSEGLPSDAFDDDEVLGNFDFEPYIEPEPETDYSSWPAESSPAPEAAYEHDDEQAGFSEHDSEEDLDNNDIIDEDDADQDEADHTFGDEDGELLDEDEDALEYALEDELEPHDFEGGEDWGSEASDLFVNQDGYLQASLENILSRVRRNHARALNLVSELHSAHSLHPFDPDQLSRDWRRNNSVGPARDNQRQNQRHHPYGMPQDRARERGGMAGQGNRRNSNFVGDELVEVEMQPPRAARSHNRPPARAQPEVIDLTGEPDSPDEPEVIGPLGARALNAAQNAGRNPRRQNSLIQRTPSLSRTDGSILGNHAEVIDLTLDDSPAAPPLPLQLPRRDNPNGQHQHRHHRHYYRNQPHARPELVNLLERERPRGFGANIANIVGSLNLPARLFELAFVGGEGDVLEIGADLNMDNPLAGNIPNLNYRGNGEQGGADPKPQHVPPPAARDGFTRDTGSADDVIVCPSCERELKYDPDPDPANEAAATGRPVKRARTKKDQEEHHFWALKECGHVYCKDCYEGRKSTAKSSTAKFRRDGGNNRKVLCAVEDCTTEAVNKQSWVGLFL